MPEFFDQAYNNSIPFRWWESDQWRPTKWAYKKPDAPEWGNSVYYTTHATEDDNSAGSLACVVNNVYLQVCYYKKYGWSFLSALAQAGNFQRESNNNPSNWEAPYPTAWTWAAVVAPRIKPNGGEAGFGLGQWTPSRTMYHYPARTEWGDQDPWYPVYYNGWYQIYFNATEVFDYPYHQWTMHSAGQGHNPATNSPYYPNYPGLVPTYNFRISFKQFAAGVIGDPSVQDNDIAKLNYLTECYYWDYEQVADYRADYTLTARQGNARNYYSYLQPIFGTFTSTEEKVQRPPKPGPDFGLKDLEGLSPAMLAILATNNRGRSRKLNYRIGDDQ